MPLAVEWGGTLSSQLIVRVCARYIYVIVGRYRITGPLLIKCHKLNSLDSNSY